VEIQGNNIGSSRTYNLKIYLQKGAGWTKSGARFFGGVVVARSKGRREVFRVHQWR